MLTYSFENKGSDSLYEYLYKLIKTDILEGKLSPMKNFRQSVLFPSIFP